MPKLKKQAKKYAKPKRPARKPEQVTRIGPPLIGRMYQSARPTRVSGGWSPMNSSADNELVSSLSSLRSRCRALIRDAGYAKQARRIIVNNVIGSGITIQALVMTTRDDFRENVNDEIESLWDEWSYANNCHTGGALCFADLERAMMGQVFDAGEVFIRKHYRAFGESKIPYALELIEAERLVDDFASPGPIAPENHVRMGVEVDRFYRPAAYWIRNRHPSETRFPGPELIERVPASEIFHLRIVDRWPQTRGEPWLHAVANRLNDSDGYVEAELTAAWGGACFMATIESPESVDGYGTQQPDGSVELQLEPGMVPRLRPGEKFNPYKPERPNSALDPFMRYLIREIAAGAGTSYESLSRDYSQSNYSSSRLSLLDDRDSWKSIQQWFIRNFRAQCHREWLRQAILSGTMTTIPAVEYLANPEKFYAVRFKPRGWSWVDPEKEVAALKEAVRCGFTTTSDVIAQTGDGDDFEDKIKRRDRELRMQKEYGLAFDTDPVPPEVDAELSAAEPTEPPAPPEPPQEQEKQPERYVVQFNRR